MRPVLHQKSSIDQPATAKSYSIGVLRRAGKPFLRRPLALLASLACTGLVQADILDEGDLMAGIPSVVSSTRMEQPITEAPSSVTIITREMIEALGAQHIAEVFNLVPGFQAFYSNGMTFGVAAHGFSDRDPRRMEVRVNGRSVYLPQLSSVAWESLGILPSDIDHIEVARGSNVPAYGSNAILGAINIITLNPVESAGGSITAAAGSHSGMVINSQQHIATESMDLLVRAAYKENDGFHDINDESHVGHMVVSGVYAPNLANTINFELGMSRGSFGVGDTDHLDWITDDDRDSVWLSGNWEHRVDNQLLRVNVSYADHNFDISRKVLLSEELEVAPEEIPLLFPGHTDEAVEMEEGRRDLSVFNFELEHHWILNDNWRTLWGIGSRVDRAKSDWLAGDGYTDTSVYYTFGNVQWNLTPDLALNLGLMIEDKDGLDTETSPRLALNYHFNPDHHMRIGVTKAYRQPALMETDRLRTVRFSNGDLIDLARRSRPDVQPEEVNTYEVGYLGYWDEGKWSLDARIFREEIRGAIDLLEIRESICLNPQDQTDRVAALSAEYCMSFSVDGQSGTLVDDKVLVVTNTADWTVEGVEADLTWKPNSRSLVRVNFSYLDAGGHRLRKVRATRSVSQLYDSAPENSVGLLLSHKLDNQWKLSSFTQYADFHDWRSGTAVGAHTRTDVKLSRQWQWNNNQAELAFVGQNLFNDEYQEYQNMNDFDRRGYVSFSVSWP